jgi:hypothetical protein
LLERLAVVGAGDGSGFSLCSGELGSFSEDVEELVPADTSSPPSASPAATFDGPPCTVIFAMSVSSSGGCVFSLTRTTDPHSGHFGAPTE